MTSYTTSGVYIIHVLLVYWLPSTLNIHDLVMPCHGMLALPLLPNTVPQLGCYTRIVQW